MRSRIMAALVFSAVLLAAGLLPAALADDPGTDSPEGQGDYVNATCTISTSWGTIKFMFYELGAPITCANFIMLSDTKFYDGCKFHRCIDDFVAQTGDPNSKNSNPYDDGYGGSSQTIPLEVDANLTHIDGALGMARSSDPNSASSQFYICDGPQHGLDGNYAVFGVVIEGLDVAKKIAAAPTYGSKRPLLKDHPIDDIVMESVTVEPGYWENGTNSTNVTSGFPIKLTAAQGGALGVVAVIAAVAVVAFLYIRKRRKSQHAPMEIS
jgi:peptidyl-prolyl cis-trans isomerase B (cyclophilin B)